MKNLLRRLIFRLFFRKIPKKQFGRCITCDANKLCMGKINCRATFEQQYERIDFGEIIKKL